MRNYHLSSWSLFNLSVSLALIISTAFPRFRKLQQATDGINAAENLYRGIRV